MKIKFYINKDGKNFDEFKSKKLISKKGSIYFWSALTIHGTIRSLEYFA